MTRTSKALKRLGVAGLAVATVAGVVALPTGAAQAAPGPVAQVTLTQSSATAPSGTCVSYTATARNSAGQPVTTAGTQITVTLTEGSTGNAANSATFCNPTTGAAVAFGSGTSARFTVATTDDTSTSANEEGTVTFGVVDTFDTASTNASNTTTVTAYSDTNGDFTRNGSEPFDFRTQTVTRAPNSDDVAQGDITATPANATNVVGEAHVIRVTVESGNSRAAGIRPFFRTEAGSANTVTFRACDGVTNSVGQTTCTYTGTTAGNDVIRIFVNQSRPGAPSSEDFDTASGSTLAEPSTTVNKTYQAAQTNRTIRVEPDSRTVVLPSTSTTFLAVVDTATTGTSSTTGTLVRFTVTGGSGDETVAVSNQTPGGTAADCTTTSTAPGGFTSTQTSGSSARSFCQVTVNDPTPISGQVLTVTATVRGTSISDSGTATFTSPASAARKIALTPNNVTTRPGDVRAFTATVTDADGRPVAGVFVTFTEDGAGRFVTGSSSASGTTNAAGQVVVEVVSQSTETGQQTITATISAADTQCEEAAGANPATTQAGNASPAGNCTATATHTFAASATTPPTTPPTTAPTTAPTTPAGNTPASVTINTTSTRITAGNAPRLFGTVRDASGNPVANQTLVIFQKVWGQNNYTVLQTESDVVTDQQGNYSLLVRPDRQRAYIVRAGNVQSRPIVVQVHNRINVAAPRGGAVLPGRSSVVGDLDPNFASVRVGVAILRNGRYTYVTQGVTRTDGSFVIPVTLPRGSYAVVVYTSARQGTLYGSASRAVQVR